MGDDDTTKAAEAAIAVMNALQPLTVTERSRVLSSAAALFGLSVPSAAAAAPHVVGVAAVAAHSGQRAPIGPSGKPISLVELLKDKAPATNDQRIACFAYYREKVEGKPNFSSTDLASYFAKAKLPAPGSNFARDYKKAVRKAWLHDEGANSYLTQEGEAAVDAGFDGRRNPRKAASKRKAVKSQ